MVSLQTPVCDFGHGAPEFSLPGVDGRVWSLGECRGEKGLLVMFICNHCPYVKHVIHELINIGNDYLPQGIGVVAINSNDVGNYPDDHPDKMKVLAAELGFPFPYLYDESQEVAKAYDAACTPDFDLFDANGKCVYRGQLDASRPGNNVPVSGKDLRTALDLVVSGKEVPANQIPSVGCNIKWRK